MEACATAHYWAREIGEFGHEIRLVPLAYVKPFVKRQENDVADAEAIAEAATRPTMRFVEPKTPEQQARAMVFRTRELFVRQRTQTINALWAHLAEHGLIAPKGLWNLSSIRQRKAEIQPHSFRDKLSWKTITVIKGGTDFNHHAFSPTVLTSKLRLRRRFHNAHHHRTLRQQLVVVWDRLLIAEPEGPALFSIAITYLLSMLVLRTHNGLQSYPLASTHHINDALGPAFPTSIHDPIYNIYYFPRNQFDAADHRELRQAATNMWREIACLKSA